MSSTPQEDVRKGYNIIAERYLAWNQQRPMLHDEKLDQVLGYLDSSSKVLELGCGAGIPITKKLTETVAEVIANDYSEKQIELAKQNAPNATYVHGDMSKLSFPADSFNAVVAFYSFFHLPRETHKGLLTDAHSWLKKDGVLLFTHLVKDEETYLFPFLGVETYMSSFGVDDTVELVKQCGFEVIQSEVRAQGNVDDPDDPDNGVSFLWILARKGSLRE